MKAGRKKRMVMAYVLFWIWPSYFSVCVSIILVISTVMFWALRMVLKSSPMLLLTLAAVDSGLEEFSLEITSATVPVIAEFTVAYVEDALLMAVSAWVCPGYDCMRNGGGERGMNQ